jgi:tetratricopeptide (TPR) repeat protein
MGNSQDFYMSRDFSWVMRLPLPGFGVVLPWALVGLVLAFRRWRETFLLIGMVLIYAASLTIYFVLAHYRMPVVPFFLILAAGAAWAVVDLAWRGRKGAMALALAGVLAGTWIGQMELIDRKRSEYMIHFNLANRYRMMGQLERAVKSYERSIALNNQYISAYNNLALTCEQLPKGRECAIRAWRAVRALGLRHNDPMYVDRAEKRLQSLGDTRR